MSALEADVAALHRRLDDMEARRALEKRVEQLEALVVRLEAEQACLLAALTAERLSALGAVASGMAELGDKLADVWLLELDVVRKLLGNPSRTKLDEMTRPGPDGQPAELPKLYLAAGQKMPKVRFRDVEAFVRHRGNVS